MAKCKTVCLAERYLRRVRAFTIHCSLLTLLLLTVPVSVDY